MSSHSSIGYGILGEKSFSIGFPPKFCCTEDQHQQLLVLADQANELPASLAASKKRGAYLANYMYSLFKHKLPISFRTLTIKSEKDAYHIRDMLRNTLDQYDKLLYYMGNVCEVACVINTHYPNINSFMCTILEVNTLTYEQVFDLLTQLVAIK